METRYRVRLKNKTKIRIILTMGVVSAIIALVGLNSFRSFVVETPKPKIVDYIFGEVLDPTSWETARRPTGFFYAPGYPYGGKVKTKNGNVKVGSYKPIFEGNIICVGVQVDENSYKTYFYVAVDLQYCG
jgi:hypothetical protein